MIFERRVEIEAPAEFAFDWHARPGALQRLLPPWQQITIHSASGGIEVGATVDMAVPILGPVKKRWLAEHTELIPGREFVDVQREGPFAAWRHRHIFEPRGESTCMLIDQVDCTPPLGSLGRWGEGYLHTQLEQMFAYRHERTKREVELHYQYRDHSRLRVLVTGSTGLVGESLVSFLTTGGHSVVRLVRDRQAAESHEDQIFWDIRSGQVDQAALEGFDAVVHLAGASIAGKRWTESYKKVIRDSRVDSTRLLAETLARLDQKPAVFISTSAIGYYGDRGAERLDESSSAGTGYLPEVAQEWERAADPARLAGIRVVHPRLGLVLSPQGGALEKMLPPFLWGAGGVIGSGQQYWSSVSIHDVVGAFHHALMNPDISGPMNVVMPESTTCREFVKTLGKVLGRPTICAVPSLAIRTALGEMGQSLLLEGQRVAPSVLFDSGYDFQAPTLQHALQELLGR